MKNWNTIILSDLHLGSVTSNPKKIIDFLKTNRSNKIILNGDIIDVWALRFGRKLNDLEKEVLRTFKETSNKVIYVVGNHDRNLTSDLIDYLNDFEIVENYVLDGIDGKKYYCFHGDILDVISSKLKWFEIIIFILYENLLYLFKNYRKVTNSLIYFSNLLIKLNNHKKFINKATKLVRSKNYDVAICGHTHTPIISEGYMNSGNCSVHLSYLLENFEGKWTINKL